MMFMSVKCDGLRTSEYRMAQPTALIRLQVRRGFALLQGRSNASAPTVTRVYELRVDKGLQLTEGIRCWRRNP